MEEESLDHGETYTGIKAANRQLTVFSQLPITQDNYSTVPTHTVRVPI